jgi:hypothetical protein
MDRYTDEERAEIYNLYCQNGCSVVACWRALRDKYGAHNRPCERTIRRIVEKFLATGSVRFSTVTFTARDGLVWFVGRWSHWTLFFQ